MFKNFFKKTEEKEKIVASLSGKVVKLEDVPDPVFNQKMMGDGIAIDPSKGEVVSPVNGKVVQIPDSKHAIGLESEKGTEILIHVGLETVALAGKGFTTNVSVGDRISVGQTLITFDLDYIREKASSTVTPMVITNSNTLDKKITVFDIADAKAGETVLIEIE